MDSERRRIPSTSTSLPARVANRRITHWTRRRNVTPSAAAQHKVLVERTRAAVGTEAIDDLGKVGHRRNQAIDVGIVEAVAIAQHAGFVLPPEEAIAWVKRVGR